MEKTHACPAPVWLEETWQGLSYPQLGHSPWGSAEPWADPPSPHSHSKHSSHHHHLHLCVQGRCSTNAPYFLIAFLLANSTKSSKPLGEGSHRTVHSPAITNHLQKPVERRSNSTAPQRPTCSAPQIFELRSPGELQSQSN